MKRRGFFSRVVGATVGVGTLVWNSGCVGRVGLGTASVDEREPPDRPNTLTEASVTDYVTEFEAVRTHNVHADAGAADIDLTTAATFDYEIDGGYHATVQHAGTVSYDENGTRSVGEIYSHPTPYRVTDDETIRLSIDHEWGASGELDDQTATEHDTDSDHADEESTEDTDGVEPLGIRLCNVLDRPREIDVEVTRHEEAETTPSLPDGRVQLTGTWTVDAREAIELRGIAAEPGSYRVVARVSENGLTGEGRIDVEFPGVDRAPNVDVVSSSNGLSTRSLPAFDPV